MTSPTMDDLRAAVANDDAWNKFMGRFPRSNGGGSTWAQILPTQLEELRDLLLYLCQNAGSRRIKKIICQAAKQRGYSNLIREATAANASSELKPLGFPPRRQTIDDQQFMEAVLLLMRRYADLRGRRLLRSKEGRATKDYARIFCLAHPEIWEHGLSLLTSEARTQCAKAKFGGQLPKLRKSAAEVASKIVNGAKRPTRFSKGLLSAFRRDLTRGNIEWADLLRELTSRNGSQNPITDFEREVLNLLVDSHPTLATCLYQAGLIEERHYPLLPFWHLLQKEQSTDPEADLPIVG